MKEPTTKKMASNANLGFEEKLWAVADKHRETINASKYFNDILLNLSQNQILKIIHDNLSPRIFSGKIRVKDAGKFVGETL